MRTAWPQIRISEVKMDVSGNVMVGDSLRVSTVVHLGPIEPEYVTVQAYIGETVNGVLPESHGQVKLSHTLSLFYLTRSVA